LEGTQLVKMQFPPARPPWISGLRPRAVLAALIPRVPPQTKTRSKLDSAISVSCLAASLMFAEAVVSFHHDGGSPSAMTPPLQVSSDCKPASVHAHFNYAPVAVSLDRPHAAPL
jgi:hypothetical protein